MESWSYASEGKGFLFSDEVDLPFDPFARNRKTLVGWDTESVESMELIDLGYTEMPKRSFRGNKAGSSVVDGREDDIGSSKLVAASPSCMFASNSSLESGSNLSNSLMESNSPESSLIDLKLGRLADCIDAQNTKFSKERSVVSSVSQTFSAKRARTMSSRCQHPFCQVYGCNKDLTSSKDYHKRHKVCEVHTKTPKVIVNGIEQRFCQQCSRFHLLVEFDHGKRSCRKRLAGHNERRRKPQFAGKPLKSLQSYQGTNFLRTSMPKRGSYLFPSILPAGMLYPGKYEQADFCRHIKLEESSVAIPVTNAQLLPKSFLHLHGNGIQNTSGISSSTTGDFTVFNAAPTIHELAGVSHSSCALSLLSPESQEMSHSVGNTVARSFNSQANRAHYSMGVSDKSLGVGSLGKYVPNGFYSYGMNSIEVDRMRSFVGSDASHTAVLPVALEADGFLQELDCLNPKYCVSPEHGSTLDLLQLSSHLRRLEQQRNSIPVKHENLDFFSFNSAYGV